MACTVAVETVIVEHYNDQLRQIMEASPTPDKVYNETKYLELQDQHRLIFNFLGVIGDYNEISR